MRYDYDSPFQEWWQCNGTYVWGALAIAAIAGLITWGSIAAQRDRAECLMLRGHCELGDVDACVACLPCDGGGIGAACASQIRAAAMRTTK